MRNLRKESHQLKVVGTYSLPFVFEKNAEAIETINAMLKNSSAGMLFVDLRSLKQEIFVDENRDSQQIPLSYSIDIAIDYIDGRIKRTPVRMGKEGIEWFFAFATSRRGCSNGIL